MSSSALVIQHRVQKARSRSPRIAVTAVFVAHGLLFASWTAHIPHVKHALGLSDSTLGLVLLATPVGSVCSMLITGRLHPVIGSRKLIDLRFSGKRDLRAAQSAVGTSGHRVRVHCETIDLYIGNAVRPDDAIGRLSADHGTVFCVRSGVQVNRRLPRNELALRVNRSTDSNTRVIAARGKKGFFHA